MYIFHSEGGDTLEQVAQGGCGCPIPGGVQGQSGCGSGQRGLVVGDPAQSRGLELDDHCGPFQTKPFYDSLLLASPSPPLLEKGDQFSHSFVLYSKSLDQLQAQ